MRTRPQDISIRDLCQAKKYIFLTLTKCAQTYNQSISTALSEDNIEN